MTNLAAEVTLEWADNVYLFALKAKQIEELEHVCGEGIGRICMRVFGRVDYSYKNLRETIRLGLIGGGTDAVTAKRLVETYVDGAPISPFKVDDSGVKLRDAAGNLVTDPMSTLSVAGAILNAVHFGWSELPDAPLGEQPGPVKKQTSGSTGPHSSEPELTPQSSDD